MTKHSATPSTASVGLFWLLLTVVWLASLGVRGLIHPDEGRYAELALAMYQSGDWITPRLNGFLYFEKPALQYWMGAIGFSIFGVNDFAARLWPGLTGLLSVFVVGYTAQRLWGAGQLAALVMAGSVWVIANSHFLNLDTGLMFFLALALCGFLLANHEQASDRTQRCGIWVVWVGLAGATLSKGLVGLVIPSVTLVIYSLTTFDWKPWRRMRWSSGLLLFSVLAIPWFVLVSVKNQGFAEFFFIHEHFDRFLTTQHKREGAVWYFVPVLLYGFLPWTSLLPGAVWQVLRHRSASGFQTQRFLLIWTLFVFVFFSISASKLPSYILPMFPALALLVGRYLQTMSCKALRWHLLPLWLVGVFCAASWLLTERFVSKDSPLPIVQHFLFYVTAAGGVFLGVACIATLFLRGGKPVHALMSAAGGVVLATTLAMTGHDAYSNLKSSRDVVRQIQPHVRYDSEIFSVRYYDQSFPYYLRRAVTQVQYIDEFEFGQRAEPGRALSRIDDFISRWPVAKSPLAMLDWATYEQLKQRGLPMQVVYEDARRLVVVRP
ncbi:MAG: glycosyltransferase family 39 protein [Burkholderiales bacterium]|jgi:4-amino-4-deoxy-L-arabinose transferase-like glycosyltransferase|nr:glycosyltransferase family 39 protein [Burkholderiales bacterium]